MVSVQRARYYSESWFSTDDSGLPLPVRVAMAMRNVYENMDHYLDPDDRIAGYWTEQFLGVPIDIERGVFNEVLETELTRKTMLLFRARSMVRGLAYMVRKGMVRDFVRNQRISRAAGTPPLNMELKTMSERAINPYHIAEEDRHELLTSLLPGGGKDTGGPARAGDDGLGPFLPGHARFRGLPPGNTSRQVIMLSTCATIATIQGHVILDYERVLRRACQVCVRKCDRLWRTCMRHRGRSAIFCSLWISLWRVWRSTAADWRTASSRNGTARKPRRAGKPCRPCWPGAAGCRRNRPRLSRKPCRPCGP